MRTRREILMTMIQPPQNEENTFVDAVNEEHI
jgi:hypothetical protein